MPLEIDTLLFLFIAFFIVATLYASVGFGGGSSYLALLSLFGLSFFFIRSNALLCNLIVVSGSTYLFYKNRHFVIRDFLPFIITSVPAAFLGAIFKLHEDVFFILLGITLSLSALFLLYQSIFKSTPRSKEYPAYMSYLIGAGIGLLSGIVGIGGGIFLAPILHHLRWGKPIKIAALAAFFILANSISGLAGLYIADTLEVSWPTTFVLLLAVVLGGQLGVRFSLKKASPKTIKIGTAILVLIVGLRILLIKGLG